MKTLMAVTLTALILSACAGSPGTSCDPQCSTAEASAPGKDAQAAAAAASSGQSTEGKQLMTDTLPANPSVTWGRGEGDVSSQSGWEENRSQSGAPVVSQGLLFPANANAENVEVGGTHPLISTLQLQIEKTNAQLDVATATGNTILAEQLRADLKILFDQMHTASVSTAKTVTNNYNFEGSIISQGVSSSSGANARPGTAKTEEGGTSTGRSVGEILQQSGVVQAAPDSLPEPPAGVVPEKPVGAGGVE